MKNTLNNYKFEIGFILFTVFNFIQAIFYEIHYDEAYYWVYSNFLDWGYFDHPPMVAWALSAGRHLFPGTFGIRFFFICMSSTGLFLIWKMIKDYKDDPLLYWAIVFSITLFIPYTFFAIPDIPIFFFTIVYFYFYRSFLKKESFGSALLLGLAAALMIYSKYHAVLIFFFTFLSNLKLIRSKYAWIAVGFALLFTMPHWYWQYANNFPSIRYQLVGNHQKTYTIGATLEYLGGQLVATGLLTGWLLLYAATKSKVKDEWERSLKFTFLGVFIFFFLTTFSGDIENHWTFVAYIPMLMLAFMFLTKQERLRRLTLKLGLISFILFSLVRIAIMVATNSIYTDLALKHFHNDKQYEELHKQIGDYPVVTQTTYAKAALYAYFAHKPKESFTLSNGFYHPTQFDFYPTEEYLQGKTVCYMAVDSTFLPGEYRTIPTVRRNWYVKKVENFRSYGLLQLKMEEEEEAIKLQNNKITVPEITLSNPYKRKIKLNENPKLAAHFQCYVKDGKKWKLVDSVDIDNIELKAEESHAVSNISFTLPEWIEPGEQLFFIGINNGFFKPVQSHVEVVLNVE